MREQDSHVGRAEVLQYETKALNTTVVLARIPNKTSPRLVEQQEDCHAGLHQCGHRTEVGCYL